MRKKTKNSKKPGRDEVIKPEDLLKRYKDLKQFYEYNWGRIGLELQRVRKPEEIITILNLVPGVEWCVPFRDEAHLGCLRKEGSRKVGWREVRQTRQQHIDAIAAEDRLWSAYHLSRKKADEATVALKVLVSQLGTAVCLFPFFFVVAIAAEKLNMRKLTTELSRVEEELRIGRDERQSLRERLGSQQAYFVSNEIVSFVRSTRHSKSPDYFAKATAGLPEYVWLHSLRKCEAIEDDSPPFVQYSYRLFELLTSIVRKIKPLKLSDVEARLREKLLQPDGDALLRAYVTPHWAYMKQAFAQYRGKGLKRSVIPYKIIGSFLASLEKPKTMLEIELAKRDELA